MCVCLCVCARVIITLVILHAKRIFSTQHYIYICGLSLWTLFFHIISLAARFLGKKFIEHKMSFDFLYPF